MFIKVAGYLRNQLHSKCIQRLVFIVGVLALVFSLSSPQIMAQDVKPPPDGPGVSPPESGRLTPSMIEKLYPMSPQAEAALVHTVPNCPVIIDGILYQAGQISLFNGKRLRFASGANGDLYAFTTAAGLEQFQSLQRSATPLEYVAISTFYLDWLYSGLSFSLPDGQSKQVLYSPFDNSISSIKVSSNVSWVYLFDYANFSGDYFGMPGGSLYPFLSNQGWNDRTSSILFN